MVESRGVEAVGRLAELALELGHLRDARGDVVLRLVPGVLGRVEVRGVPLELLGDVRALLGAGQRGEEHGREQGGEDQGNRYRFMRRLLERGKWARPRRQGVARTGSRDGAC